MRHWTPTGVEPKDYDDESHGLANKMAFKHVKSLANLMNTSGKQIWFQKTPTCSKLLRRLVFLEENIHQNKAATWPQKKKKLVMILICPNYIPDFCIKVAVIFNKSATCPTICYKVWQLFLLYRRIHYLEQPSRPCDECIISGDIECPAQNLSFQANI